MNNVQPYVTEIVSDNDAGPASPAKVDIICDPNAAASIKRMLISRGGLSVRETRS